MYFTGEVCKWSCLQNTDVATAKIPVPPNLTLCFVVRAPLSSCLHQGWGHSAQSWAAAFSLHLSILTPGSWFASKVVALRAQAFIFGFCWVSSSWSVTSQLLQQSQQVASTAPKHTAKQSLLYHQLRPWFSLCMSDHSCLHYCLG